jgi:hypothetical protein
MYRTRVDRQRDRQRDWQTYRNEDVLAQKGDRQTERHASREKER